MQFPNKLTSIETFYEYLKESLIKSKSLTLPQTKIIFLKALKDYFAKNIDEGNLMIVAVQLYWELNKNYEIDVYDRKLGKALLETTEIEYYKKEKPEALKKTIKLLQDYYQKNTDFLKS